MLDLILSYMETPPSYLFLFFGVIAFTINATSQTNEDITFPPELATAEGKVVVRSEPCSVTCGLGIREQEVCLVKKDGSRGECEKRKDECLTSWDCGLQTFTVPIGVAFKMNCFSADTVGLGLHSFLYTWRYAFGLITTNEALFRFYRSPSYTITFNATKEADAGTYRCDVSQVKTSKFVKRIHFGLKLISDEMIRLKFDESEASKTEQENKEESSESSILYFIGKHVEASWTWEKRVIFIGVVGVGSGLLGAVIIWNIMRCFYKILRKSKMQGENIDSEDEAENEDEAET